MASSHDKLVQSVYTYLAARIKKERECRALSMLAVAEQAGLSQQMVSYVERGMRNPSLGTLIRVCDVLELDLAKLLGEAVKTK